MAGGIECKMSSILAKAGRDYLSGSFHCYYFWIVRAGGLRGSQARNKVGLSAGSPKRWMYTWVGSEPRRLGGSEGANICKYSETGWRERERKGTLELDLEQG